MQNSYYKDFYGVSGPSLALVNQAEESLAERFQELEDTKVYNQLKVLRALKDSGLSQSDFFSATGYGYGDTGKEKTERIFRQVFQAQDCIVRPSLTSGTHAIATVLFSLLDKGDLFLSATGHPYDTLQEVIGFKGEERGTLLEKGVSYRHVPLVQGKMDWEGLEKALQEKPKLVLLQRSTGYSDRRAFTLAELEEGMAFIRKHSPESILFVDNCYGEFTEKKEPTQVGADLMAGSLIKNPGGGIALSGGYIAGRKDLVELCMNHLTAPGLGKETGLTFHTTRPTLQGFFLAPHVTAEALKGALLFSKCYEALGYACLPKSTDPRSDIICAIKLGTPEKLIAFCQAVQGAASVGADVLPLPWDMPGYSDQVIMASGGFIDGSSIEVSADGPLRPPYIAYYQGGMVYEQAKLACLLSLDAVQK